ncbi:MAG: hypothetical protein WC393_05265 [Candidatus Nanoarchaeia archaeon]|jgi:cytochrome b subunit of formate dehydrogenase
MVNFIKIIHWTLFILTIAYLITGLGVTYYQIVTALSFGLLNKALCMQIHEILIYAFIPALCLHLYFKLKIKK